jgi:putative FmdB family regulatory protein
MPFYEYECPSCRFYAEVLQKLSDAPLRKCPSCGKGGFKRLISAPVFRLKGAGWYETDFKSDQEGKRNLAGAEQEESKPEADAAAQPKDQNAAEAKPADQAEAKAEAKAETKTAGNAAEKSQSTKTAPEAESGRTPAGKAPTRKTSAGKAPIRKPPMSRLRRTGSRKAAAPRGKHK